MQKLEARRWQRDLWVGRLVGCGKLAVAGAMRAWLPAGLKLEERERERTRARSEEESGELARSPAAPEHHLTTLGRATRACGLSFAPTESLSIFLFFFKNLELISR